jgi:excisionase family DNA binding protein
VEITMENTSIEKLMKSYFEYVAKYPAIVKELRSIKNLPRYISQLKEIIPEGSIKKDLKIQKEVFLKRICSVLEIFEFTEAEIIKEESKKDYQYPTYNFETTQVLNHVRKMHSITGQRNYLRYVLKEYKNHILFRYSIFKDNQTKAFLKNPDLLSGLMSDIFLQSRQNKEIIKFINTPDNIRTFEEVINEELNYYLRMEVKEEQAINIDKEKFILSDLIKHLDDSKSIEINDYEKFNNIVYSFFNMKPPDELEMQENLRKTKTKKRKTGDKEIRDEYLTTSELEKILKVKRTTLYLWRKEGKIPYIRSGRKVLFQKSAVEKYLENNIHQLSTKKIRL